MTRAGLVVVVLVLLFWFLILSPTLEKVRRIAMRTVCGTHLNSLGNACIVYSADYDGSYPRLPGEGPWSKELGFSYFLEQPDFKGAQLNSPRSITASWYLLVRQCDVDPNTFNCPWAGQTEFKGDNPANLPLEELWDFGGDPYKHVSYSYHLPYGKYPSGSGRSAAFAVAADTNSWFKKGDIIPAGQANEPPQIIQIPAEWIGKNIWEVDDAAVRERMRDLWKPSNTINELPYTGPLRRKAKYAEGQNVLFADGHTSFETQPNVAVKNDNIYTFWSAEENPTEQDIQGGTAPASRGTGNDAQSRDDSFLAI